MKKKLSTEETKKLLKKKTMMFAFWNCEYKEKYMYQNFYQPIKSIFKEVILFDPKKRLIAYGSEEMRKRMIESVAQNKPDYLLFTVWGCGEFESIDLIESFREASPKTKILGFYADDDRDFEISSRFYAPFMDYNIVVQPDYTGKYIKEGNKAFSFYVVDTKSYAPIKSEKKYDVSFIGSPNSSRLETMRFLIKNGIKINLWGRGWSEYPEFKEIYHGAPGTEEFSKIICESRINIGFSKNQEGLPHFKARILEVGALGAFTLVDYFKGYVKLFAEDKEMVMFKNDQELVDKIKYYLKNPVERENVAKASYNKITKSMEIMKTLDEIFNYTLNDKKENVKKKLPVSVDNAVEITREDVENGIAYLKDKVKNYDYVVLRDGEIDEKGYKKAFQAYALEKSGKDISCCSYYFNLKSLGNIIRFRPFHAFKNLNKDDFDKLLNLNQLAMTKKYFLGNLNTINEIYSGKLIDFVDRNNTLFIDVPLFKTSNLSKTNKSAINKLGGRALDKAFQPNFALRLYTKMSQKKLLSDSYVYKLAIVPLFKGNTAILKYLYLSSKNKGNWDKLDRL